MEKNKNNNAPYLSDLQKINPLLYNWNTVFVRYCDGGSYAGNSIVSARVSSSESQIYNRTLYFKGKNNRDATIHELLSKHKMGEASDVLISGCSAGGLGVLFGADKISSTIAGFNSKIKVKVLVDSGIFLDYSYGENDYDTVGASAKYYEALTKSGELDYSKGMKSVFELQKLELPAECIHSQTDPSLCMFAENFVQYITTPIFFLQPQYDSWQLLHVLGKASNVSLVNEFGKRIKSTVKNFVYDSKNVKDIRNAAFIDSCVHHCYDGFDKFWMGNTTSKPGSRFKDVFSNWLYPQASVAASSSLVIQDFNYPCLKCCDDLEAVATELVNRNKKRMRR